MHSISHTSLLKISLLTTLCCLITITFVETQISSEKIEIKKLDAFDLNKPYSIEATISKQSLLPQGHLILTLQEKDSKLQAIMFSVNTTFKENSEILATGRIKTYKGELQMIIEKIKVLN